MLILLPPSEGKTAPAQGDPVDLGSLVYPELLGGRRDKLLDALERLGTLSRGRAIGMLGVSKGQAGEVDIDAELRGAPAAPAGTVYTGVLYERLGLPGLPVAARRRVLIASALWGVVRPEDRVPLLPPLGQSEVDRNRTARDLLAPRIGRGDARRARRPRRRHALGRLRGGLEAEKGDAPLGAGLQ